MVKRGGNPRELHRLNLREVHSSILEVAQNWCKAGDAQSTYAPIYIVSRNAAREDVRPNKRDVSSFKPGLGKTKARNRIQLPCVTLPSPSRLPVQPLAFRN